MPSPALIAHRGDAARYPENTLPALAAAVRAGAPAIEFDLQMTADGAVVLLHDASLLRTAGIDADIRDLTLAEAARFSVGETARFGARHGHVPIPTLEQAVQALRRWPRVTAFVEIKDESTDRYGVERVTRKVLEALAPVRERCVLISFSADVLRAASRLGAAPTGWCFEGFDAAHRATAAALNPEVLLGDWRLLPDEGLWTGRWRWALWEVVEPDRALSLHARGATWIETMDPGGMLADPRLRA